MIDMRLRLRELMAEHNIPTAYQLAKASKGRISPTNAHRLVHPKERPARVEYETLEALCDIFDIGPGELLERERVTA